MNTLKRIEIKIGDSFIVAQQRYRCVKKELQSCLGCDVGYEQYEVLQCMGCFRTDNTDVCFVKADETK